MNGGIVDGWLVDDYTWLHTVISELKANDLTPVLKGTGADVSSEPIQILRNTAI